MSHHLPVSAPSIARLFSEKLAELKIRADSGIWKGISSDSFSMDYDSLFGFVSLSCVFADTNNHTHKFKINFSPGKGYIEDDGEDDLEFGNPDAYLDCVYYWEGEFDSNLSIKTYRSFAEWVKNALNTHALYPDLCTAGNGLHFRELVFRTSWEKYCDYFFSKFVLFLDVVTSNIRPTAWFITEPLSCISSQDARLFLLDRKEDFACLVKNERWSGLKYKYAIISDDNIDDGELLIKVGFCYAGALSFEFTLKYCCLSSEPMNTVSLDVDIPYYLTEATKGKLRQSVNNFFKVNDRGFWNLWDIDNEISISQEYIDSEYAFPLFCNLLDEFIPLIKNHDFSIPLPNIPPSELKDGIMVRLDAAMPGVFEVESDEAIVNKRLKCKPSFYDLHPNDDIPF